MSSAAQLVRALLVIRTATDLETKQCALRIVDRVVFNKPVLHSRVNTVTRDRKNFPVRAYIEHVVIECVRAVEVNRLAQGVRIWIAETPHIAQTRIAGKTDRSSPAAVSALAMLSASFFTREKLWLEIKSGPVAPKGPHTISKQ